MTFCMRGKERQRISSVVRKCIEYVSAKMEGIQCNINMTRVRGGDWRRAKFHRELVFYANKILPDGGEIRSGSTVVWRRCMRNQNAALL